MDQKTMNTRTMRTYMDINAPVITFVEYNKLFSEWWYLYRNDYDYRTFEDYVLDCTTAHNGSLDPVIVHPHPKHERLYLDPATGEIMSGTYLCDCFNVPAEQMTQYLNSMCDKGEIVPIGTHSQLVPYLWR